MNMNLASGLGFFSRRHTVKNFISKGKDSYLRFYCKNITKDMHSELSYANGSTFPPLNASKLRLYSMRFCPYAQRTRLVLVHKNIRYETVNINLQSKPNWFLQRNPLGLVPVLEQDDKIIYESLVCNDYLDEVYPDPILQPTDPYLRAKHKMLIGQFDKLLKLLRQIVHGKAFEGNHYQAWLSELQILEENLDEQDPFFGGEQVGMLDYNLWPWFERLEAFQSLNDNINFIDKLPTKLSAWRKRMFHESAVQATMFDPQQHSHFLKSLLQGRPDFDAGLKLSKL